MNSSGELIIGKSMLHRTLTEFDVHHARDPVAESSSEALAFQSVFSTSCTNGVLKIRNGSRRTTLPPAFPASCAI